MRVLVPIAALALAWFALRGQPAIREAPNPPHLPTAASPGADGRALLPDDSTEPPSPDAATPPEVRSATIDLTVRDCRDGSAIPDLLFAFGDTAGPGGRPGSGPRVRSDASGLLTIAPGLLRSLRVAESGWELALPGAAWGGSEDRSIWVFRRRGVRVRVRFEGAEGPVAPGLVLVVARAIPGRDSEELVHPLAHGGDIWLERTGLARLPTVLEWNPDSGFHEGRAPVVRSLGVRASCHGWLPAHASLDDGAAPDDVLETELLLRPGITVSGRVVPPPGSPDRPRRVRAHLLLDTDIEGLRHQFLRGGGYTAARGPRGTVALAMNRSLTTDAEGRFSIELEAEGRLALSVWEAGVAPCVLDLGTRTASLDGLVMELKPPESHGRVRLLWKGEPLTGRELYLSDLTLRFAQPSALLTIDGSGTTPAHWFGIQREYGLGIGGASDSEVGTRFLVWNGQSEIELSTLPLASDVLSR